MDQYLETAVKKGAKMVLAAVLIMAFLLAGCATGRSAYAFLPSDVTHIPLDDSIIMDINDLGLNTLRLINEDDTEGRNMIISPVSLSTAISILNNGAAGTTPEEINSQINTRGLTQDVCYGKNRDLISSFYNRKDVTILPANSLWVNKEYRVKESFIELARAWYDAEVFSLNVKSPSAVNQVNKWISDKTKDFITNPVSGIDPDTIMLIVNTLYFKGAWIDEFNKECTEKEDFTLGTGETVQADMMNGQFRVPYYNAGDFKAAKLHYEGGVSMLLLRPEGDVNELVESLSADMLLDINDRLKPFKTNLKVPKLSYGFRDEMSGYLKKLGMVDAFSGSADFSGMVEDTEARVNRVLHECRIELDEEGTVAAAATVIEKTGVSAMTEPEEIMDFYLDRPFVFAIMDNQTGAVFFLGKVENPAQ